MRINKEQFKLACNKVMNVDAEKKRSNQIGTLGEKTLHAVLKHYFEPFEDCHEIKVGSFIADIMRDNEIIEIQTRQFNKLRNKLVYFLTTSNVTIVYPIPRTKWLCWINEETGEVTKKRKSPKCGKPYEIFYELYKIKQLLREPNLRICIVMLELEEYRFLNGWNTNKKRGSSRCDRIPVNIIEEIKINSITDYSKLIPENLGQNFTSKEFQKATGLSLSAAQTALNVLYYVDAVLRVGKQGNTYVYKKSAL